MKKKSIKFKISMLYISLIIVMLILGAASLWNMYAIRQSVTNLITTNYNSIERITSMKEALDAQKLEIMLYIYDNENSRVHRENFDGYDRTFMSNYSEEYKTIVIPKEVEIIKEISGCYESFGDSFDELMSLEIDGVKETEKKLEYFNENIYPLYTSTNNALNELLKSNEKALFERQNEATDVIQFSIKILLSLFVITGGISYITSKFYTNRLLKPIYEVTENIKSIRQGNMNRKTAVEAGDELGVLCAEFNNMTQRLSEFEQSTMGSLMEEKNRTFAVMRSITEPMVIIDEKSNITLMNRSFEKLFSTTIEESFGKHFLEVVSSGGLFDELSKINYRSEKFSEQIVKFIKNGKTKYYNVMVTPFHYCNGNDEKFSEIIVFYDITEMKELEKMRSDFIATVSHEFKTPLTSIVMGADLLSIVGGDKLNSEQIEIINTIKEDSDRLCTLVNDLLELSKIESAEGVYNFSKCNMKDIINSSLKQFKNIAKNNKVEIYSYIDENIPFIIADESKITWVLNNLLSNALKYTKENDTITVRSFYENGFVKTSVSDTGMGIPEDFIDRVFEKYVQVSGCDIEVRGSGIGLSASKNIIDGHKGRIWCESSVDWGSTFTFILPVNNLDKGDLV